MFFCNSYGNKIEATPKYLGKTVPKTNQRNCMGWCLLAVWCPSTCGIHNGTWDETCKDVRPQYGTLKPIWRKQPFLAVRNHNKLLLWPNSWRNYKATTRTDFCQIKRQTTFISWPNRPTIVHTLPCRKSPCALMVRKNMFAHFTMYLQSWNNLFCGSTCNMFQGNWRNNVLLVNIEGPVWYILFTHELLKG